MAPETPRLTPVEATLAAAPANLGDNAGDAFDNILQGLKDADAFLTGDRRGDVNHQLAMLDPEFRAIRTRTGLLQTEFVRSIGVKKATLLNWEQGERKPDGPARVLLALIVGAGDCLAGVGVRGVEGWHPP